MNMKRIVFAVVAAMAMMLTACSYGVYSVSSGMADEGYVCFVDNSSYAITVVVDGESYQTKTVKQAKDYKARRNIKATSRNKIALAPGNHEVKVVCGGREVYSHTLFVSATETKMVKL